MRAFATTEATYKKNGLFYSVIFLLSSGLAVVIVTDFQPCLALVFTHTCYMLSKGLITPADLVFTVSRTPSTDRSLLKATETLDAFQVICN